MKNEYDIIIIGGGPAGLSAALTAGRGNRSILIFDDNRPRNAPAAHMMNFPAHDGTPPNEFRQLIKEDLKKYPKVEFIEKKVHSIERVDKGFLVDHIFAKKILLAHGISDLLPDVPGLKELWGKSVFHCPYCHGYEYLNREIGIITTNVPSHLFNIVKGLSSDLVLFTDGQENHQFPEFKIYTNKIETLIYDGDDLKGVKLQNGEVIKRRILFVRALPQLTTDIGTKLGCELTDLGLYKVDEFGLTSEPGIYAAGDIATPMQSVLKACSMGQMAGAAMNAEILNN